MSASDSRSPGASGVYQEGYQAGLDPMKFYFDNPYTTRPARTLWAEGFNKGLAYRKAQRNKVVVDDTEYEF